MKRFFSLLVAILLLATPVYALSSGDNGAQHEEYVYVTDMGDLTSGDTVILQTTSPTYSGREVTSTTTAGLPIYGVVLGEPSRVDCDSGTWIRIQTHGYVPINVVRVGGHDDVTSAPFQAIVTSGVPNKAALYNDNPVSCDRVICMETRNGVVGPVTTSTYNVGTRLNAWMKGL